MFLIVALDHGTIDVFVHGNGVRIGATNLGGTPSQKWRDHAAVRLIKIVVVHVLTEKRK